MKTLISTFILLILLTSCQQEQKVEHISGRTMGTTYNVRYLTADKKVDSKNLKIEMDELMVQVNQEMSTYIKESELSKFNYSNDTNWKSTSNNLFEVINYALKVAKETDGVFDPTIGPLVNLWGFGPDGKRKVPSQKSIEEAKKRVGYKYLLVDENKKAIKKVKAKMYVDLSASAKGFGVDVLAKHLDKLKIENYMVEIGGEVITKGLKKDRSWRIAIEAPNPMNQKIPYQKVLNLSGMALATSGDYRNFFTENGKKYSHTIDYKTGKPVAHTLASVSVAIKDSCMKADSWATALLALGPKQGMKLAEELKIAAYFIYRLKDGEKFTAKGTTSFNKLFKN